MLFHLRDSLHDFQSLVFTQYDRDEHLFVVTFVTHMAYQHLFLFHGVTCTNLIVCIRIIGILGDRTNTQPSRSRALPIFEVIITLFAVGFDWYIVELQTSVRYLAFLRL
jgi:hypothetical protein